MKIWQKKVLSIFAGLFLFLSIAEIGARVYFHIFKPLHRPSKISGLLWEPTPGADVKVDGVRYKVNSKGLRDYEYFMEKPEGVFRIAVMGDSVTWGYTEMENTYPKILEKELKRIYRNRKFEILNFGIQGIDLQHHLGLLREKVVQYKPDLVVLGYCLNDIRFSKIYDSPLAMWFLQHSNFLDFLTVKIGMLLWDLESRENYYESLIRSYEDQQRLIKLRTILRGMNEELRERRIRFAAVIFPFRQQFLQSASIKPQESLLSICNEEGIPFLDPFNELKKYDTNDIYIYDDVLHFSSPGNEILAKSILSFLKSTELLKVKSIGKRPPG